MSEVADWLATQVEVDVSRAKAALADDDNWYANEEGNVYAEPYGSVVAIGPWDCGIKDTAVEHMVAWQPERALAECAVKQQVIGEYRETETAMAADPEDISARIGAYAFDRVIRAFAATYDRRPGFREDWRLTEGAAAR